jgi:Holliday junction resolvasome RuvABC ATP-dependent DNA helicase subunit
MYTEKYATKKVLLEQMQMFEMLLDDKAGREIAYKRMHTINQLLREIDKFTKFHKNQSIRDIVVDQYQHLSKYFP